MAARKERDEEEKPKAKAENPDPPERSMDDDGVVEVELKESEGDDEEEVEVEEPERPTRAEKKRQRGNAFKEAQERAAAAEARAAQLEAQQQAYLQQQHMQAAQAQSQQQVSQAEQRYRDDLKTFYQALEASKRADGTLAPEHAADFERKAMELKEREFQIMSAKYGTNQQVNPQQIAAYVEGEQLKAKYADVLSNQAARSWGEGRLYQLASERGLTAQNITKAQYYELLEEAAEETRQRFGLGNRRRAPAPDAATKARFSGVPARSNGGNGETIRVTVGSHQRRMAMARYPDLSEEEAVKKWAHGPGKRAQQAMQRKSG
jgi:hypothetical protein